MKNFYVIEGTHKDPNQIETILKETEKKHGPFEEKEANQFAKGLIQKNIDDFYHRAWVLKSNNLTK
jgi:hypothetical protein|tara:strand:- start:69 stop:266 length:198 start_codon:yes stop_codon:yes gene_type:complete